MKYLKVFTDFAEIIDPLQDAEVGRLFKSMLSYAESGTAPDLRGNERFVWNTAKQIIDREAAYCEKQAENGRKGGRPKNPAKPSESLKDKDKDKEYKETLPIGSAKKREDRPSARKNNTLLNYKETGKSHATLTDIGMDINEL